MLTRDVREKLNSLINDWVNTELAFGNSAAVRNWLGADLPVVVAAQQCLAGLNSSASEAAQAASDLNWLEEQLCRLLPLTDEPERNRRLKERLRDENLARLTEAVIETSDFEDGDLESRRSADEQRAAKQRSQSRYSSQYRDQWMALVETLYAAVRFGALRFADKPVREAASDPVIQTCLNGAVRRYHRLWNFCPEQSGPPAISPTDSSPAAQLLLELLNSMSRSSVGHPGSPNDFGRRNSQGDTDDADFLTDCSLCAWLSLWSLLDCCFGQKPPPAESGGETTNTLPMGLSFALEENEPRLGACGRLDVDRIGRRGRACFLDPSCMGLILLDQVMHQSISDVWKLVSQELAREVAGLRLAPQGRFLILDGPSAGEAFRMGMYLTAQGEAYDSSTVLMEAIELKEYARQKQFLTAQDFSNGPVGDVALKVEALLRPAPSDFDVPLPAAVNRFVVHPDNEAEAKQEVERLAGLSGRIVDVISYRDHEQWIDKYHSVIGINRYLEDALKRCCLSICDRFEAALNAIDVAGSGQDAAERPLPERFIEPHYAWSHPPNRLQRELLPELRERQTEPEPLLTETDRNAITLAPGHQTRVARSELSRLLGRALQEAAPSGRGVRLCLAEDANSGKTVFSQRLKWFVAEAIRILEDPDQDSDDPATGHPLGQQPLMVYRWENRQGQTDWPVGGRIREGRPLTAEEQLRDDLSQEIQPFLPPSRPRGEPITADQVIEYALDHGRIVCIFDALDQAQNVAGLMKLFSDPHSPWRKCHVVVTGRSFAFDDDDGHRLFPRRDPLHPENNHIAWTFATLLGFSQNQQARYFDDLLPRSQQSCGPDWELDTNRFRQEFFPKNYEALSDLLTSPGMLAMLRQMVKHASPLGRILTRADLHWVYYQKEILGTARLKLTPAPDLKFRELWLMMLSVTAFRMVLDRLIDSTAAGDHLDRIKEDVELYCQQVAPRTIGKALNQNDWEFHWNQVSHFTSLSSHGVLEPTGPRRTLGFRHKSWHEFFMAVFLSRYADPKAFGSVFLKDSDDTDWNWSDIAPLSRVNDAELKQQLAGIPGYQSVQLPGADVSDPGLSVFRNVFTQLSNDSQWYWGWRMAMDLLKVPDGYDLVNAARLSLSLGTVFERPARGRRPTELMFRIHRLMDERPHDDALHQQHQKTLLRYRGQFHALLHSDEVFPDRIPRAQIEWKASRETVAEFTGPQDERGNIEWLDWTRHCLTPPVTPPPKYAPMTMDWAQWTQGQIAAQLVPEKDVAERIRRGEITARHWKQIAPPGWGWFLAHRVFNDGALPPDVDDAALNTEAIRQLMAWEATGFADRWTCPVLARDVYFPHDERSFVAVYPLDQDGNPAMDFEQRFRQSLEIQETYSESQIQGRLDHLHPKGFKDGVPWFHSHQGDSRWKNSPWHPVRVSAVWLQAVTVTRSHYALFDPVWTTQYADSLAEYAPDPDAPALFVSWWDSMAFALFCGLELPSECAWEFAARGGRDEEQETFGIPPYEAMSSREANIDGNSPDGNSEKGPYLQRTLPGRWSAIRQRLGTLDSSDWDRNTPMSAFVASACGLWQMHGNAWEWTRDGWNDDAYETRQENPHAVDPEQPADLSVVSFSCCVRGGGWRLSSRSRSGSRFLSGARNRLNSLSFRLLSSLRVFCQLSSTDL